MINQNTKKELIETMLGILTKNEYLTSRQERFMQFRLLEGKKYSEIGQVFGLTTESARIKTIKAIKIFNDTCLYFIADLILNGGDKI